MLHLDYNLQGHVAYTLLSTAVCNIYTMIYIDL